VVEPIGPSLARWATDIAHRAVTGPPVDPRCVPVMLG